MIKMKRFFLYFSTLLCLSVQTLVFAQQEQKAENPFSSNGVRIFGKPIDTQTRCIHWHSSLDIIAIKFKCCDKYFPCYSCHEETSTHQAQVWPITEFDTKAILCGECGTELSINDYMGCNNTCPKCSSLFNPGCSKHYHLYFEVAKKSEDQK
jgi:uncharacterized CHY-type Zn-finger protein